MAGRLGSWLVVTSAIIPHIANYNSFFSINHLGKTMILK